MRSLLVATALAGALAANADILAGEPDPAPAGFEEYISPIVIPSPPITGQGSWANAVRKAKDFVSDLTLEEKVNITTGVGLLGRCVGSTGTVPRKGFAGLCLQDGPAGVRATDYSSLWPVGINTAALWDKKLVQERAEGMGYEFRQKGVNIALAPGMGMSRGPASGRNFEYAGADPYLAGMAARYTVIGLQSQGVIANAKHYIGNDQEHGRGGSLSQAQSSNIDDRTFHEISLWPFAESIEAGVASIMCSYQRLNQTYGCENSYALNGILKGELGFQGPVLTDWASLTRGIDAALAGTDMNMPGFRAYTGWVDTPYDPATGFPGAPDPSKDCGGFWGANLIDAVNNGTLPESRLTDMAIRVGPPYFKLGQDKPGYPDVNFSFLTLDTVYNGTKVNEHVDVQRNHKKLIRQIGAASAVLLKNEKKALPLSLDKLRSIGIFGSAAFVNVDGPNACADRACAKGTVAIGFGSGTANFPYLIDPYTAILHYATQGDYHTTVQAVLNDTNYDQQQAIARQSDVCLVFVSASAGEGYLSVESNQGDRNDLELFHNGTGLVHNVASQCDNVIVGIQAPDVVNIEAFVDNPNVKAIVNFGMAGQEAGNAVVDILFGKVNPSGRLPYTWGKSRDDYPYDVKYFNTTGLTVSSPVETIPQNTYSEKLYVDYRHFESKGITPRYAFGYGLSYTTFSYDKLSIKKSSARYARELKLQLDLELELRKQAAGSSNSSAPPPATTGGPSGNGVNEIIAAIPERRFKQQPDNLYDTYIAVDFFVHNTGDRDGHEVAQLYLSFPESAGEPPKILRGFERVHITGGGSAKVALKLRRKDVSVWDTPSQSWKIPEGEFKVHIGAASNDIRLTGSFAV